MPKCLFYFFLCLTFCAPLEAKKKSPVAGKEKKKDKRARLGQIKQIKTKLDGITKNSLVNPITLKCSRKIIKTWYVQNIKEPWLMNQTNIDFILKDPEVLKDYYLFAHNEYFKSDKSCRGIKSMQKLRALELSFRKKKK